MIGGTKVRRNAKGERYQVSAFWFPFHLPDFESLFFSFFPRFSCSFFFFSRIRGICVVVVLVFQQKKFIQLFNSSLVWWFLIFATQCFSPDQPVFGWNWKLESHSRTESELRGAE